MPEQLPQPDQKPAESSNHLIRRVIAGALISAASFGGALGLGRSESNSEALRHETPTVQEHGPNTVLPTDDLLPIITANQTAETPEAPAPEPAPTILDRASAQIDDKLPTTPEEFILSGNIKIIGNEICRTETVSALDLLKKSPQNYKDANEYIKIIACIPMGTFAWPFGETPTVFIGEDNIQNTDTLLLAGEIAHEKEHLKKYIDYVIANPGAVVPPEVYSGYDAERQCTNVQAQALEDMGAPQNIVDWYRGDEIMKTRWWEQLDKWLEKYKQLLGNNVTTPSTTGEESAVNTAPIASTASEVDANLITNKAIEENNDSTASTTSEGNNNTVDADGDGA